MQREAIFSRWPGTCHLRLPAPAATPRWLTGRFDSLAVRVTNHPLVVALCQAYGKPLVSTSANLSGIATLSNGRAKFTHSLATAFPVVHGETGGVEYLQKSGDALTGELFRQG